MFQSERSSQLKAWSMFDALFGRQLSVVVWTDEQTWASNEDDFTSTAFLCFFQLSSLHTYQIKQMFHWTLSHVQPSQGWCETVCAAKAMKYTSFWLANQTVCYSDGTVWHHKTHIWLMNWPAVDVKSKETMQTERKNWKNITKEHKVRSQREQARKSFLSFPLIFKRTWKSLESILFSRIDNDCNQAVCSSHTAESL